MELYVVLEISDSLVQGLALLVAFHSLCENALLRNYYSKQGVENVGFIADEGENYYFNAIKIVVTLRSR